MIGKVKNILFKFNIFVRSFFIQSVWNFERMQNVGFAFTIIPFLKVIYHDKNKFSERLKAHFGFFNTHPYLANLLVGITMRLEEKFSSNEVSSNEVMRTKTMLAGPIAAIGDRFIWSTWRVFCGMISLAIFMASGVDGIWFKINILTIPILFLFFYNILHIPIRCASIEWGYKYSNDVIKKLSKFSFQNWVSEIRVIGILILLCGSFLFSISTGSKIVVGLFWLNVIFALFLNKRLKNMTVFYIVGVFDIIFLSLIDLNIL